MTDPRKQNLADALAAMSGGPAATPSAGERGARAAPRTPVGAAPSAPRPDPTQGADDAATVPPPDPSVFAPRHTGQALRRARALRQKRTFVPILLTLGLLLPALGSLKWLMPDTPFATWPTPLVLALPAGGVCLLVVAILNMLQVKSMLLEDAAAAAATTVAAARGLTQEPARS